MSKFYSRTLVCKSVKPFWLCAILLCTLLSNSMFAQLPNGFVDGKAQGGYTTPMGVAFTKNGQQLFVWEKSGKLWISNWNGTAYVKPASPALDISGEVGDWRDFGFQNVCLDPNFDTNGLIYMFYQVDRHHLFNFGTPQYDPAKNEYYNASISRVTRYKLNNNNGTLTADYNSRKILLGETKNTGVPLVHESHAGGQIVFGSDGTLLVTTGDNASYASVDLGSASETYWQQAINDGIMRTQENVGSFRSQMLNSFCGKVLRLDPNTGDGIASNPHYNAAAPRSAASRMWAMGLRNPYRQSIQPNSGSTNPADANPGKLFIGDVGWNTWEDLHIVEKGGTNLGWPVYEGMELNGNYANAGIKNQDEAGQPTFLSLCNQPTSPNDNTDPKQRRFVHKRPALDWKHGQNIARVPTFSGSTATFATIGSGASGVPGVPFGGNAATAGTWYNGTSFPASYQNGYFFGDYGQNWIRFADVHATGDHAVHEVKEFAPAGYCKGLVDIEMNPLDGSIFYVNINTGDIQRISFGGNRPPVAQIGADKTSGASPLTVNFNSNGSNDPDGNPITYDWNFGDGTANSTAANPTHTFNSTGSKGFTVTLTVKDNQSLTDSKTLTISTNNNAPSVKITVPANNAKYPLDKETTYTGAATVTDNDATGMKYEWQVTLRHNTHEHREPVLTAVNPALRISPVGCDGEEYYYLITCKVTDNGGLTALDSVKIYPDCGSGSLAVTGVTATAQINAAQVKWTNPAITFDEVLVVAKENSGFIGQPSGTTFTADANFQGGGTAFEGGKVVYRGNGTLVNVTGLTGGRKYFFRIYTRKGNTWTGGVETSATPTSAPSVCNGNGQLYCETWNNIGAGNCVTDIPVNNAPTSAQTKTLNGFELQSNIGDNYGTRVRGYICAPESGDYTFYFASDDGGVMYLSTDENSANKRQIAQIPTVPACGWAAPREWTKYPEQKSVKINLVGGRKYYVEALFKEGAGGDNLAVGWQKPSNPNGAVELVPNTSLSPFVPTAPQPNQQLGCLKASYFNNIALTGGPSVLQAESSINYDWAAGAPVAGINADNFSVRWEGTVIPSLTGTYTFTITGDDGIRLWVNNQLLVDKWIDQAPTTYNATINLIQNANVPIKVEYYERGGGATAKLFWTVPNQASKAVAFTACPITQPAGFDANKCYKITARHSGRVLEVQNASTANGANIVQNSFANRTSQVFKIVSVEPNYYRLTAGNSGKSFDISGVSQANGANLQQYQYGGGENQKFKIQQVSGVNYFNIIAKHSGKYLDVFNGATTSGAQLVQWPATGGNNQLFAIAETACPAGVVAAQTAFVFSTGAYKDGRKAVITWSSNAGYKDDYFVVEKMDAQGDFQKLEVVNARGGNFEKQLYTTTDNAPSAGENTYRVQMVRTSEAPQYSGLMKLDFAKVAEYMVFPNPTTDYVDVELSEGSDKRVVILITDVSGKILIRRSVEEAGSDPERIELDGLESGQYFIHIKAEGKREVVRPLVVAKY
jgi:glucose/arabinose dehydrogenase